LNGIGNLAGNRRADVLPGIVKSTKVHRRSWCSDFHWSRLYFFAQKAIDPVNGDLHAGGDFSASGTRVLPAKTSESW
jgi:hypothetical protein